MSDRLFEAHHTGMEHGASSFLGSVRQAALAAAWTVKHGKPLDLPLIGAAAAVSRLVRARPAAELDPRRTVPGTNGFVAICPDLAPETLLGGYRAGLHQCSHVMPPKWWSYDPRMVVFFDAIRIEKNLRRKLRQANFTVTFDTAFSQVVRACAAPRNGALSLTWLIPPVIAAFERLHRAGHAHSVEVRSKGGELVGGLFGVAYGGIFTTESQFTAERDMSKIAFLALNRHLQAWGFAFNDVGRGTPHLAGWGGEYLPRDTFLDLIARHGQGERRPGPWSAEPHLSSGDWLPEEADGARRAELVPGIAAADAIPQASS